MGIFLVKFYIDLQLDASVARQHTLNYFIPLTLFTLFLGLSRGHFVMFCVLKKNPCIWQVFDTVFYICQIKFLNCVVQIFFIFIVFLSFSSIGYQEQNLKISCYVCGFVYSYLQFQQYLLYKFEGCIQIQNATYFWGIETFTIMKCMFLSLVMFICVKIYFVLDEYSYASFHECLHSITFHPFIFNYFIFLYFVCVL